MKKIISLLLAVVMCLSLVACGGESKDSLILYKDGVPHINIKKLPDILEIVELTTDNWKEYIKTYSYSIETVEKNAFDEVISTETTTYYQLGAGSERYHCFEDVAIELKNITTGDLIIYEFDEAGEDDIPEDFNLNNYECTRIMGKLVFVNLPQESLYSESWTDNMCFRISQGAAYYTLSIDNGTNALNSRITVYLDKI